MYDLGRESNGGQRRRGWVAAGRQPPNTGKFWKRKDKREGRGQTTTVRVPDTDQFINHECEWNCVGPDIKVSVKQLDGGPDGWALWCRTKCNNCKAEHGLSLP
jgi:hypothetical protein